MAPLNRWAIDFEGRPMTSPSVGSANPGNAPAFIAIHRGEVVALAVIGLLLGVIALVWPGATLVTIAILFGIYLVASGIFRITVALISHDATTSLRWLSAILGILVVAAGVYCLASPERSLAVLAFVIGFGWVAEGVIDIMAGVQGVVSPSWLALASGAVSIIAGIVAYLLPGLAVATFLTFGAILLIVVSASTLLTLPRRYTIASS
jgi:uncharacterized membrane protein HdeD (DUF308 family)